MANNTMTRDQMAAVIQGGGAVVHQGAIYTSLEQLPSEADLAGGDANRLNIALEDLQRQRDELDREIARVNGALQSARGKLAADPGAKKRGTTGTLTRVDANASTPPPGGNPPLDEPQAGAEGAGQSGEDPGTGAESEQTDTK